MNTTKDGGLLPGHKLLKIERSVPPLSYELFEGIVKHLQGEILTLAEATVEPHRLQPTKNIIKANFNNALTRLFEVAIDHDLVTASEIPHYDD